MHAPSSGVRLAGDIPCCKTPFRVSLTSLFPYMLNILYPKNSVRAFKGTLYKAELSKESTTIIMHTAPVCHVRYILLFSITAKASRYYVHCSHNIWRKDKMKVYFFNNSRFEATKFDTHVCIDARQVTMYTQVSKKQRCINL